MGTVLSPAPDQRDLATRSVAAVGWTYAGAFSRLLAQLVIQVALARLLGPHAFGQATAAMLVLGVGWIVADGGFGSALIQRKEVSEHDIGYALGWVLLISVVLGAVGILGAGAIASALGDGQLQPLILACAGLIPLQALSNLPASLMRRRLDMKRLQLLQLSGYVVGYGGVGLTLAWLGWGAWSLVMAFAVQSLVSLAGSYACVRHTLRPRISGDSSLRVFGLNVMGTNMANWAIDNLDRMIVSRQWGAVALGEYSAASNLSRTPASLLVSSVQSVLFASASRLQSDTERLGRVFLAVLGLISLLSFPVFTYLALHAELVVHTLYGERWKHAAPLFAAFCCALPFFTMLSVTGPMLWAVGAVASELRIQVCTGVCVVAGFWTLSRFPLENVVWLIPLIYALRVLLVYLAFSARIGLHARRTLRTLACGLFFAAVTLVIHLASSRFAGESWLSAGAGALLTTALCLLALRATAGVLAPPELATLLRSRAAESAPARWLSHLIGVR
jgi:PST family polysaccharide transporter